MRILTEKRWDYLVEKIKEEAYKKGFEEGKILQNLETKLKMFEDDEQTKA